jgi:multisubunit Na+/H+ antiporter MnhG subunit
MQQNNPYSAPESDLDSSNEPAEDITTLNDIASGQRLLIISIAISILSFILLGASPALMGVIGIIASVIGVVGVVRMTRAFGRSIAVRMIYSISILLPLINLLVMFLLSSQATDRLRSAGYKVGLFGANLK